MKQIETNYKIILKKLATKVQKNLDIQIQDNRVIKIDKLSPVPTNTFGWRIDIYRFAKISGRGTVQIWIDLFPNIGRPILCICFWNSDIESIRKVAVNSSDKFVADHSQKIKWDSRGVVLQNPLQKIYFGKYLIEKYERGYYSYYFHDELKPNRLSNSLVQHVSKKIQWLLTAIPSALEIQSSEKEFSAKEDRKLVLLHKLIERRNVTLAKKAKSRDNYVCQVCDFDFLKTYGDIGHGFAEAHHIIALSTLRRKKINTPEDLITVCSNCHRILHRMEGNADDYKKLRRLVKRLMLKK